MSTWVRTLEAAAVERETMLPVQVGPHRVALYAADGEFFATSDICTHGQANLTDGYFDGELVECPLHQGLFDVRTGAAAGPPCTVAIQTFPVRVEDGYLMVCIE